MGTSAEWFRSERARKALWNAMGMIGAAVLGSTMTTMALGASQPAASRTVAGSSAVTPAPLAAPRGEQSAVTRLATPRPYGAEQGQSNVPVTPSPKRSLSPQQAEMLADRQIQRDLAHLNNLHSSSPADPEWQQHLTMEVTSFLPENKQGAQLGSVDCRSDLCKLSFAHDTSDEVIELFRDTELASSQSFGGAYFLHREQTDDGYVTRMILARPGRELPVLKRDPEEVP